MKNMTQNIHEWLFLIRKLKMGSRMLRIVGTTKWAIHPKGERTKIVKPRGGAFSYPPLILVNGGGGFFKRKFSETVKGGAQGKQEEGGKIPQTQQNKHYFTSNYISHGGGGHPPSPVTVQNCMLRILVFT